ncbi:unnamed protein product [Paramecium octaurelia]|uniref:Uncharacterized protein n=1 Tax=Paramecium octaurelia TaxID=43137 RepID=A0A8S1WXB7_PAROT|nr:unnamed protein product [Paramecium octaurelia]
MTRNQTCEGRLSSKLNGLRNLNDFAYCILELGRKISNYSSQDKKDNTKDVYRKCRLQNESLENLDKIIIDQVFKEMLNFDIVLLQILYQIYQPMKYNEQHSCSPFKNISPQKFFKDQNINFNNKVNPQQYQFGEMNQRKQNMVFQVPNQQFNNICGYQKVQSNDPYQQPQQQFNIKSFLSPPHPRQVQVQDQEEEQNEKYIVEFKKLKEVLKERNTQRIKRQSEMLNQVLVDDFQQ